MKIYLQMISQNKNNKQNNTKRTNTIKHNARAIDIAHKRKLFKNKCNASLDHVSVKHKIKPNIHINYD